MGKTYKKIELVGISTKSFEEAISDAVNTASKSLHGLSWFDVVEQHGKIVDGKIAEFQVVVKVAFKLD